MAHHHSALKQIRASKKASLQNHSLKAQYKTLVRKVLEIKTKSEASEAFNTAMSFIDSLTNKRIINNKLAARKKSQLARYINSLS
jgi:small subunit ribosomal protein S20